MDDYAREKTSLLLWVRQSGACSSACSLLGLHESVSHSLLFGRWERQLILSLEGLPPKSSVETPDLQSGKRAFQAREKSPIARGLEPLKKPWLVVATRRCAPRTASGGLRYFHCAFSPWSMASRRPSTMCRFASAPSVFR
jgi:hypothetical protein